MTLAKPSFFWKDHRKGESTSYCVSCAAKTSREKFAWLSYLFTTGVQLVPLGARAMVHSVRIRRFGYSPRGEGSSLIAGSGRVPGSL